MDDQQNETGLEMILDLLAEGLEEAFLRSVGLSDIDRESTLLVFRDSSGDLAFCTHKGLVPTNLTSVDQLDARTFQMILNFPLPIRLADCIVAESSVFPDGLKAALESHIIYKKVTKEDLSTEDLETLREEFAAKAKVDASKVETMQVRFLGDSTTSTTTKPTKTIH